MFGKTGERRNDVKRTKNRYVGGDHSVDGVVSVCRVNQIADAGKDAVSVGLRAVVSDGRRRM
jgi:hypothetical protein